VHTGSHITVTCYKMQHRQAKKKAIIYSMGLYTYTFAGIILKLKITSIAMAYFLFMSDMIRFVVLVISLVK
jgi:hypothetical protein